MRKIIISAFVALMGAGAATGQCPLSFDGADEAQIGVLVMPVNGGEPLVDYNADRLFTPASVMKSVTSAAALARYGGGFRWQTTVMAVGKIEDGKLKGDIVVRGSGDPTLGSSQFSDTRNSFLSSILEGMRSAGIKSIEGKVRQDGKGWPNEGPNPTWELEDIPGIDGAGFYSLNYMDNVFILSFPSLTTQPPVPGLTIQKMGGSGSLWFNRYPGSYDVRVYGQLGKKQKAASFKCSMPNPPEVLLDRLEKNLAVEGKEVKASADTLILSNYYSPELKEVTRSLMVRSDNQMAEATLRLLALQKARATAITEEKNMLAEIGAPIKSARIADGSGLSRHNSISPRQLCGVLSAMSSNPDYVGSYARVGLDGTVKNFLKGVPGRENFILKSGSMTGVVCYTGYRLNPTTKAPTHVIAIMINNAPDASKARAGIARFLASLKY